MSGRTSQDDPQFVRRQMASAVDLIPKGAEGIKNLPILVDYRVIGLQIASGEFPESLKVLNHESSRALVITLTDSIKALKDRWNDVMVVPECLLIQYGQSSESLFNAGPHVEKSGDFMEDGRRTIS